MKQIRESVKKEDTVVKSKTTHHSQTDAAKGFGGRYGVQKESQDKVHTWHAYLQCVINGAIQCLFIIRFLIDTGHCHCSP